MLEVEGPEALQDQERAEVAQSLFEITEDKNERVTEGIAEA